MERVVHKSHSFDEAREWDIQQQLEMTPEERQRVARTLRDRAYGADAPDVREAERGR
jgi:hypothetical protein